MITVREAVDLASDFGRDVFHKDGTVEEVEIDGRYLLITLGFEEKKADSELDNLTNNANMGALGISYMLSRQKTEKKYKVFKVDGEEKKVLSAKMVSI